MSGSIDPPLLETVARRSYVIKHLLGNSADKRDLEAAFDVSRTTIDRAIDSLSDADCVVYQDGKWEVTLLGKFAYEEYEQLSTKYRNLITAKPLLTHLPLETSLEMRVLADAEVLLAEPPAPHIPITRLEDILQYSQQIKGLSPVVLPQYVPLFYHQLVERGTNTDLIFHAELVEYLWTNHRDEMEAIVQADNGTVWNIGQKPPFGLVLVDKEILWFAVYGDDGGLKGTIINDSEATVTWATEVFHSYRQQAERVLSQD